MLTKHHCVYHLKSRNCAPGWRQSPNCFLLSVQNAIWHYNNKAKTAEAACSIARSLELSIGCSSTATRARALDWYLKVSSHSASVLHSLFSRLYDIKPVLGCNVATFLAGVTCWCHMLVSHVGVTCSCKVSTTNLHMQHSITTLGDSNVSGVCTHMMQLSMLYFPLCSLCKL